MNKKNNEIKLGIPYGEHFIYAFFYFIIYLSIILSIYFRDFAYLALAIMPLIIMFLFFIIEEFVNCERTSKLEISDGFLTIYKKHYCKEKIFYKSNLEEIKEIKLNICYQKYEFDYEIVINDECITKENIWTFGGKRFVPDEYKIYPFLKQLPQFTCNLYGDSEKTINKFKKKTGLIY